MKRSATLLADFLALCWRWPPLVLPDRLKSRGYRRVRGRPKAPGEFFWGFERFWIYLRRSSRAGRPAQEPRLVEIRPGFVVRARRGAPRRRGHHPGDLPRSVASRRELE